MFTQLNFRSIVSEIKNNLKVSIPLIASQLIYASSNFIGTAMVAHLGKDALAASVLVSILWITLSVLFFGILNAVSVLVSHQFGAKNNDAISRIMGQSFILGVMVTIAIVSVLLIMPLFLEFSTQPQHVLDYAYQYMYALIWTIPGCVFLVIMEQFLAGVEKAHIVLKISLLVVPIEIPLIYCLIFGKFGFPVCGVAGVGYGFAITYTLTAIGMIIYLWKGKYYQPYKIFSHIGSLQLNFFKELIRIGLPMGFMHLIEVSTFALCTFWIAHFGTMILAVHQIILQYLSFTITLVFAMSQAITVRVGHNVGEKNLSGIHYSIYTGILLNCCAIFIAAALFYFAPNLLLKLDVNTISTSDPMMVAAKQLFMITAVLLIFDNFRILGFGALRGLKDTRFPMYISLISFWSVGLTAAFILAFTAKLGGVGIYYGLTLGIALGAIIVIYRLKYLLNNINLEKISAISGA